MLLGLVNSSWALDHFSRMAFNTDVLSYEYKADQDCEIVDFQGRNVSFIYQPAQYQVNVLLNGLEYTRYSPIRNLNQGKIEFSTCWSDGSMGYNLNEFYNNRITKKTEYQDSGILCLGGFPISSHEATYSFIKNRLIIRLTDADFEKDTARDETCSFTRIQF